MGADWDPAQYHRFRDERSRPFFDLLALVAPIPGGRAIDLGCGTGELTRELHARTRAAETLGIDTSDAMLAQAAAHAGGDETRGVRFERRAIENVAGEGAFDLVFSNAALQWLPDHEALVPRLARLVAPRGQFAVQMPANHEHASHRAAFEVAREPEFAAALGGYERAWPVLPVARYAEILHRLGFREQHVRLQVYAHELPARDDVVEWVRGTLLTDYRKRLAPALYDRFLARYREVLARLLPDERPYLYAFPRVLLWGRRDGS